MDDADLEKLIVKPGKLKPKFNRNVVDYEIVLNSGIKDLNVDPLTRDCNASWNIPGFGISRKIPITEGASFTLVIEVTAEDGSTKIYNISVTSLSAQSTYISTLKILSYPLVPAFKSNVYKYECSVPADCDAVELSVLSPDKNTKIEIPGEFGDGGRHIQINLGRKQVDIHVTSPDGSVTTLYTIDVRRQRFLFPLEAGGDGSGVACAICFGIPHCPVSIPGDLSDHIFCDSCLQTVTRVNKRHPLTNQLIDGELLYIQRDDKEKEISHDTNIPCIFSCGHTVHAAEYATHLKDKCEKKITMDEKTGMVVIADDTKPIETEACSACSRSFVKSEKIFHNSFICSSKHPYTFQHEIESGSKWQKKYQQEVVGQQVDDAMLCAAKAEQEFCTLFQNGSKVDALKHLETACRMYAYEISINKKKHEAHFRLGVMLEELSMLEDIYGLTTKKKKQSNEDEEEGEFQTDESMEDDIRALAEIHGFGRNASTTQQLQALDQEYHQLLDQGQSEKADYVQKLYAFKQRQQHLAGKPSVELQHQSLLLKALQKYKDAANLEPNAFLYHMHAGRSLLSLGKVKDAVSRLRCAVSLKPTSSEARFYLGVAMVTSGDHGNYSKQMEIFLSEGLLQTLYDEVTFTTQRQENNFSAGHFKSIQNTLHVDGFYHLSKLQGDKKRLVSKSSLLKYLCSLSLSAMRHIINRKGRTFKKYQLSTLQCQYEYGMELNKKKSDEVSKNSMRTFWKYLSNLTLVFCGNNSSDILNMQRQICHELVVLIPRSSEALANFGSILVSVQEKTPKSVKTKDIELLFRASLEVEATNIHQTTLPSHLEKTEYWCNHTKNVDKTVEKEISVDKSLTKASSQKAPAKPRTGGIATKKPVPGTVKKPVPGTTGRSVGNKKPAATTKSGGYSPMKASGVSKSLPQATRSKTNAKKSSSTEKVTKATMSKALVQTAQPAKPTSIDASTSITENCRVEMNEKNYTARLGLARILKLENPTESARTEIETLYREVIELVPYLHDAYIELGEMLVKSKPLDAVEIYAKFPFSSTTSSATGSFDDGYLYGEIVRLLMKEGQYDDVRLKGFMIQLGKIMGFTSLDKYISTLENKFKYNKFLREIYAGVNGKEVDDPDLKAFFKFKCWE